MYDTELRDQWCGEALRWTCGARSRHAASRSHQAFCALRPVLGAQSASAMLAALHKCLAPGGGRHSDTSSLDTAVEVLCSLRALLAGLLAEPAKALLYPQLLLACVALLNSSVVRVVELAMHLLLQVGARRGRASCFVLLFGLNVCLQPQRDLHTNPRAELPCTAGRTPCCCWLQFLGCMLCWPWPAAWACGVAPAVPCSAGVVNVQACLMPSPSARAVQQTLRAFKPLPTVPLRCSCWMLST